MKRLLLFLALIVVSVSTAKAQDVLFDVPVLGLRTEFGVQTGVGIWNYQVNGEAVDGRLGWQVGGTFALCWGKIGIQPEIHFVHHSVPLAPDLSDPKGGDLLLRSNSVEVPVLLSIRPIRALRINLGPTFTALNKCKFEGAEDSVHDFGRVRSALGYVAGAAISLRNVVVDVRYNGTFQRQTVVGPMGNEYRAQGHAVWISIGYIFM